MPKEKIINPIDQFINQIKLMSGDVETLALIYKQCLKDEYYEEFQERVIRTTHNPGRKLLKLLERVADGDLLPDLVFNESDLATKLKKFPINIQKEYFIGDPMIACFAIDGSYLDVRASEMTSSQLNRVFDTTKLIVRGKNQQISYLKELERNSSKNDNQQKLEDHEADFETRDGKLYITRPGLVDDQMANTIYMFVMQNKWAEKTSKEPVG